MSYQKYKQCQNDGCDVTIYWDNADRKFRERETGEIHTCPYYKKGKSSSDRYTKPCINECGQQLYWKYGEKRPYEVSTDKLHECPNFKPKDDGQAILDDVHKAASQVHKNITGEVIKTQNQQQTPQPPSYDSRVLEALVQISNQISSMTGLLTKIVDATDLTRTYTRIISNTVTEGKGGDPEDNQRALFNARSINTLPPPDKPIPQGGDTTGLTAEEDDEDILDP